MGFGCFKDKVRPESKQVIKLTLDLRKSVLFKDVTAETNFQELSSSKRGHKIQWKRGQFIGAGSYGQVYQCLNLATGELMAVKHWKLKFDSGRVEYEFHKIKQEIALLRSLSHPNIVQYYQTDLSPQMDSVDVLLEYVAGDTLKHLLQTYGGLQEATVKQYSFQLLDGITYLHSQGVVHRDLKPANVLIGKDGVLKLADFGSSRQFLETDEGISWSMKGSPYWIAPEIVLRQGHSFSADLWAYGCLLIEMVSGIPPWADQTSSVRDVLNRLVNPNAYPTVPNCSKELKNLIRLCLNRNPNQRPTAMELREHPFHTGVRPRADRCHLDSP